MILTMHLARRSPGTRLPAPPNPFIFPLRPLGSKFLTLWRKAKTPFENNGRGRWNSLSFHFSSWLNFDDSSHWQSIYLADWSRRLPGGQDRRVGPSTGSMWSQLLVPWWEWDLGGLCGLEAMLGDPSAFRQDATSPDMLLFAVCLYWVGLALLIY